MSQHSEQIQRTIDFYDEHAEEYVSSTLGIDMSHVDHPFLSRMEKGQRILDAGSGSGRDTKAFLDLGYDVLPIDASCEMTKATQRLTGKTAFQLRLQEISFEGEFDGIWACASLVHVPLDEIPDVLDRLAYATRSGGVLYFSFKEGNGERLENGRHFTYLDESGLRDILSAQPNLELEAIRSTDDAREILLKVVFLRN
ncbi:MAG: class I SAM-dependent methyltransferase [Planctomycetota bacterium]|nr:class I SAM-dependent methyltransferase [Planctomycetota bacterium]